MSRFRILALDAGLLSFEDFVFSAPANRTENSLYVVITNPKNALFRTTNGREPYEERVPRSTHVRMLVFSRHPVVSVRVSIDGEELGEAKPARDSSPVYVLKWDPAKYPHGLHRIHVTVKVCKNKNLKIFN